MSLSLVGVRAHNNITQKWFSVYPEKQIVEASIGAAALTVVFGAKNTNQLAIDVKGELIGFNGVTVVGYTANVKPNETHVFEWDLDVDGFTLPLTIKISSASVPYVGGKINSIPSVSFTMNGVVSVPPVTPTPTPEPTPTMPPLPITIPVITDIVNWVGKAGFPDFKLFNLSGVDFGNILGTVAKALGDTVAKPLEGLPALTEILGGLPSGLSTMLGGLASSLISELFVAGSDLMSARITDTLKGTPTSISVAGAQAGLMFGNSLSRYVVISNPENYLAQITEGGDIMPAIRQQVVDAESLLRDMDLTNFALGLASLGQIRTVADEIQMLEGMFGVGNIIHRFMDIRQEKAVTKKVEYYFNEVYQPEIPNTQDLINMVVKEKMTLDTFKQWMLKRGFSMTWCQLIWDAHFKAPDLNDVLTAWRRGIIDETRVDELMILIDLDPTFKSVFDTRKYIDPSLMTARLMFETGAITAEQVPTYVHRLGYAPEFEAALTKFVLHFQERRYRTRYITQLMTALAQGKATEETVRAEVAAIGFTEATADLIVKTALLRATTLASASTAAKEVALTLSELKKAYSEDIVTEEFLRLTMLGRGYALTDIQIVIDILNKDKAVETAGRRQVALTVAEMLSAWRFGVVNEETLRVNLLARGLDLNEVDILIETKRKSWGVGNIEQTSS
jgi:hypothetical protein